MKTISCSLMGAILLCSGCVSSSEYTKSGFQTPEANGQITNVKDDGQEVYGGLRDRVTGNGFAYEVGNAEHGEGFAAYSGILPGTNVATPPSFGSATMNGAYRAASISGVRQDGDQLFGTITSYGGDIDIVVDFSNGTITGTSDDGNLVVDGDIGSASSFDGKVAFLDENGVLKGVVDADQVIGAFNGDTSDQTFAGGFIALD